MDKPSVYCDFHGGLALEAGSEIVSTIHGSIIVCHDCAKALGIVHSYRTRPPKKRRVTMSIPTMEEIKRMEVDPHVKHTMRLMPLAPACRRVGVSTTS